MDITAVPKTVWSEHRNLEAACLRPGESLDVQDTECVWSVITRDCGCMEDRFSTRTSKGWVVVASQVYPCEECLSRREGE